MSELRDLYQEVILDHNKRPRNFRRMDDATAQANGDNPLCGDKVTVFVKTDGNTIQDVSFQGSGCAISTASASMLTEAVKGKSVTEARAIFERFHELTTGSPGASPAGEGLGKLAVFSGVCEYPVRVKCATLVWHTLVAALDHRPQAVSTE